jgi:hypothetical protein
MSEQHSRKKFALVATFGPLLAAILVMNIPSPNSLYAAAQTTDVTKTFCASGCNYNNLQTAINAVSSAGGGKVLIKDGTYTLSSTIYLKSGVTIEFSSLAKITFKGSGKPLFRGGSVSDVAVTGGTITVQQQGVKLFSFSNSHGIKVSGTKATLVKGGGSAGFWANDSTGIEISKVDFRSATRLIDIGTSSGTTDGKSSRIWIRDSIFSDSSVEGVKVNYSTDVHIINNAVTDTSDNGIDIGSNRGTEVRNNKILRTGMPNGVAIHTDHANGADIKWNYIDATGQAGIAIYRAYNINAIGNTIKNVENSGIAITTGKEPSKYIVVKSNKIYSPGTFGIYQSPNQVQVEIAYNTIDNAGDAGIYVVSPDSSTKVYGNKIT